MTILNPLSYGASGAALLSFLFFLPQTAPPPSAQRAAALIQPADLKADLSFLASDDLAGRSSMSPEDHIATDYIASEFLRLGLKPVGDGGTYFQNMDLVSGEVDPEHTTMTAKIGGVDHSFVYNKDFRFTRQSLRPTSVCGEVAFAGYGIDAPEYGYNDFAGVNLQGKIALVLNREPQADQANSKFMGTWDTYHAFNWGKIEVLRKQGVAGLLLVQDSVRRNVKQTPASSPRARGENVDLASGLWDLPVFTIPRAVADQLLAPGGKTADALQAAIDRTVQPNSFLVPNSSVCMAKAFTHLQQGKGRNVVGLLEGSDPSLKAQTVIVTAHHDHMGVENGRIYHGADDDGSGTVAVMEVAKAMVEGKIHPRRSVLFMVYDAEERGLVGSYYYATHPIIPLAQTVANLNMDMIGRNENDANWPVPADGNINMVNVLGTRYNPALGRIITQENKTVGLKLDHKMDVVDPDSLWSRSDHYWFATLHVPQVLFQTGLQPDYHTDNDIWQTINYPKLTKIVRLIFLTTADLANSSVKIPFVLAGAPAIAAAANDGRVQ